MVIIIITWFCVSKVLILYILYFCFFFLQENRIKLQSLSLSIFLSTTSVKFQERCPLKPRHIYSIW